MSEENFEQNLTETVKRILILQLHHLYDRDIEPDIDQIIREAWELVNATVIPKRSYRTTFIIENPDVEWMDQRLEVLRNMPQPEQRTQEWYERRHNLITASNAYLAFGSESNQNRLIYEKCQPINTEKFARVNTESPMHKGQKYEPVSVMLYEKRYDTKVEDFGCITHETYPFLGASPDGINCDKTSPRYGRMLEIKNISNRDIKGIPKKEYWTQMQLQMETCKLPECDFLETRFIEYDSHADFMSDGTFTQTQDGKDKGIIVCFARDERPIYEYAPIGISSEDYEKWEADIMKEHSNDSWIHNIYWKLDELSCVLVTRNTHWFEAMIPQMQQLWDTVLKERVTGYEHRAPKKRAKQDATTTVQPSDTNELIGLSKCLISNDTLINPLGQEQHDCHNN
ncbi:MAG: lambda exonuclease family protein [Candidatus Thorarchaeota archaeon]